ncbi:IgA-binding beta antigen [Mycolicibacterium fortuitum subsp. acetamidolyticum]|uniref:IgA-binding beta antigen n=2 Tax=Mycolicibacterium fortuitum TaxID=1766 RepID=A0A100WW18_MYCFO|nr:hypothetical protein [Mycolicibacterium fortuitum]MDG5772000.1 hypothetical protein [Mycolicibacterium fortuitum]MDG5784601.1 hypothetical protein [Mycolicibacterium fortuitum]GAT05476.1 IgA-binding beta antigen [Mycolicibacterium fortuitum subsp. acetamidolyticum]
MDANSTEFPLAWITTGCHAICSLLNFFVQPDTNGGSTLSITLLALELAADSHPGRAVGYVLGRLLFVGAIIGLIVWAIRSARKPRPPQYPQYPQYPQPYGHWQQTPPPPGTQWPPQQPPYPGPVGPPTYPPTPGAPWPPQAPPPGAVWPNHYPGQTPPPGYPPS